MEGSLIQLMVMFIFGIVCALVANNRGRSAVGWFFIGFFFWCFALIVLYVIPDLKVEEERRRRLLRENQRLRERIRKDRIVADQRHREAARRLDVHDRALELDTSKRITDPAQLESLPPMEKVPSPEPEYDFKSYEGTFWYYVEENEQAGPVEFNELKRLWKKGRIQRNTFVWHESMDDWKAIRHLPDLERELRA